MSPVAKLDSETLDWDVLMREAEERATRALIVASSTITAESSERPRASRPTDRRSVENDDDDDDDQRRSRSVEARRDRDDDLRAVTRREIARALSGAVEERASLAEERARRFAEVEAARVARDAADALLRARDADRRRYRDLAETVARRAVDDAARVSRRIVDETAERDRAERRRETEEAEARRRDDEERRDRRVETLTTVVRDLERRIRSLEEENERARRRRRPSVAEKGVDATEDDAFFFATATTKKTREKGVDTTELVRRCETGVDAIERVDVVDRRVDVDNRGINTDENGIVGHVKTAEKHAVVDVRVDADKDIVVDTTVNKKRVETDTEGVAADDRDDDDRTPTTRTNNNDSDGDGHDPLNKNVATNRAEPRREAVDDDDKNDEKDATSEARKRRDETTTSRRANKDGVLDVGQHDDRDEEGRRRRRSENRRRRSLLVGGDLSAPWFEDSDVSNDHDERECDHHQPPGGAMTTSRQQNDWDLCSPSPDVSSITVASDESDKTEEQRRDVDEPWRTDRTADAAIEMTSLTSRNDDDDEDDHDHDPVATIREGDRVEARWKGLPSYFKGTCLRVGRRDDEEVGQDTAGTTTDVVAFDVLYDDGGVETGVRPDNMRLLSEGDKKEKEIDGAG